MDPGVFWEVFENTGSIEAFLTYSKSEEVSPDIHDIAVNTVIQKNQGTKTARKKNKSGLSSNRK